jgi:parallel beta-helix repeat protein
LFTSGTNPTWIIIDGLIVDGSNSGTNFVNNWGVCCHYTANILFKNGELRNAGGNGAEIFAESVTLRNMRVHNNGSNTTAGPPHGIYIACHSGCVIEDSQIYNNDHYGIHLYDSGATNVSGNIFRRNRIYGNGKTPLGINTYGYGIILSSGSNNEAYNNVIYDNGVTAVDSGGIQVAYSCNGCKVYNNTIYGNAIGINIYGSASSTSIINNIVFGNTTGSPITDAGGSSQSYNYCNSSCTGTGAINSASNPFVSSGTGNFLLAAGSTAINTGTNLGSTYSPDIAKVARPTSGPWEIGAYEYGVVTPPPVNQLVLALPLDAGTGATAVDVSGQNNNATLVGGATWDNAGKYGKAVALDGTGYLNVAPSASFALAPGMTLEAWVYPTAPLTDFISIMAQGDYHYYLYSASSSGACPAPALAPLGGYSTTITDNTICATSIPPINQWSHLAVTYDGTTMTFFLNGNPISSRPSSDPMVPSTAGLTVGASIYGEYFIGKIDEPRVYNYARTPAQIMSDMNTPLIGAPGKVVEIAAPASVEISAASSIEISAD